MNSKNNSQDHISRYLSGKQVIKLNGETTWFY